MFYGRISTTDFQDRASSQGWQRQAADEVITGAGRIVAEYFDHGVSRTLPWSRRPRASQLLAALTSPDRRFDAIVVGEYERAFCGQQLHQLTTTLRAHNIQLWLPETYGPVDFDNPRQLALLDLLGVRSQREIARARYRTTAAMRAQVEHQGRHLGGRPPYGYRLVDAGAHPNRAHARWGRRRHRLEPESATAPHVQWMFTQRLTGRSIANIARDLNDRGVPCPSSADPGRNQHRAGSAWLPTTVAAILANPRYTGRQVWNREPANTTNDPANGRAYRSTPTSWVISTQPAHPPLVSETDFVAAQAIRSPRPAADGTHRHYALRRLVYCHHCDRAMDTHWIHNRPGYRCRHGHLTAHPNDLTRTAILYVREDHLIARIQRQHHALRHATPDAIAAYLNDHDQVIVYAHHTWHLHTRDTDPPETRAPLPRQRRSPAQQKSRTSPNQPG
ncbi:recombinase family protein [Pilimelia columellifera]|uniref:Recombinase domain-containing protein n=1 Tax=Pilimelia columellifera subsp. columellifera TaxID=706583 RepID=A0ABP6B1T9_9ACTN